MRASLGIRQCAFLIALADCPAEVSDSLPAIATEIDVDPKGIGQIAWSLIGRGLIHHNWGGRHGGMMVWLSDAGRRHVRALKS